VQLRLDPKTVRRYVGAAVAAGVSRAAAPVTEDEVRDTLLALQPMGGRPRGDGWAQCEAQRAPIERWLADGLRLTKIHKLLVRQGVALTYPTLYRFAVREFQFGQTATTIPVVDGAPGQEVQLDTGWVGWLTLPAGGRRRFRAWIFTAARSRHRFVYPTFEETTARAIEACEAAWAFFGGVFAVIVPDNTKAIVVGPDPLAPRITPSFPGAALPYRPHVGAAPRDKGHVERAVPGVRDDCLAGEVLLTLDDARARARTWCLDECGLRRHSRTLRRPLEHFRTEELPELAPAPTTPCDVPAWSTPKVARDQLASVGKATYSLPTRYVGQVVTARADTHTVRFYLRGLVIKTHARQPPGGQALDPYDYPAVKDGLRLAQRHGPAGPVGSAGAGHRPLRRGAPRRAAALDPHAARLRAARPGPPLRPHAGRGRVRRGARRGHARRPLAAAHARAGSHHAAPNTPRPLPRAKYLRPAHQYALPFHRPLPADKESV
jgi:hypothetical protein